MSTSIDLDQYLDLDFDVKNTWIDLDVMGDDGYLRTVAELGPFYDDDEDDLDAFAHNLSGLSFGDIYGYSNFFPWVDNISPDTVIDAASAVFKG